MTSTGNSLPVLDGAALDRLLPVGDAVEALRSALTGGLDVTATPARTQVQLSAGHLLLMPGEYEAYAGVKVAGVAPGNPERGLPRITGTYLLLDAVSLQPLAVLDGPELTLRRTSAVSALAVDCLAEKDADRLLLYGTGPQAFAHATAIGHVREPAVVDVAGRRPEAVDALVNQCRAAGLPARAAGPEALEEAGIVACCTSAQEPLFDGRRLAPQATVVAMGSHTPTAREVDTATVTRSTVVVEDTATALREAGDIVLPLEEGVLTEDQLLPLQDVVRGTRSATPDRPRLFKSVGMAWQDLTLAAQVHRAAS